MQAIEPNELLRHLRYLTETIGVRLAGSANEAKAGEYVAAEFERAGATVRRETFPVQRRDVREQQLQLFHDGAWHDYPCSLFANTPGTNGEWVEAPLVFFEGPTGYQQSDLGALMCGRIVLHLGCHIESRENYRRLVAAGPMGVLMVDLRYPGATPLADAIFPAYVASCGAVPSLNVAYLDAWAWRERGATRARFRVVGGPQPAESQNIVAELPGTDPAAGVIFLGGHHDTQADSVGADDNGSATAGLIELARVLAPRPRRRTIRLISFGAEEQLSVGSAAYVRRHRADLGRDGRFIFNLDSFGSLLGWNTLSGNGPAGLDEQLARYFERHGQFVRRERGLMPYADHFPFVAAGLPGLTLMRPNCAGGRFFHHRPDDDLRRVSPDVMAALLGGVAEFTADMAAVEKLPFPIEIPVAERAPLAAYWEDLFGGWDAR
ncbi:MAG TPA: M28 family peptidase [Opitutaceae bacterium]|nr:M28 family peptidase [Opitutaceae bacterium]HND60021.1 M28 family peptidase [Opitutaceae bacterium]